MMGRSGSGAILGRAEPGGQVRHDEKVQELVWSFLAVVGARPLVFLCLLDLAVLIFDPNIVLACGIYSIKC